MKVSQRCTTMRVFLAVFLLLGMGRTLSASAGMEPADLDGATISLPLILQVAPAGERLVIGESVAGRPLEVYHFGSGERKKLIVGGIHGGYEWNTIELVRRLIEQVKAHPEIVPADQTLFFLPALNPDGEARSHGIQGRANENNADINRNFDYNWKSDWYRVGCWNYLPITAGTRPFSEPEAAALRDFVLDHQIEAMISYHSMGAEIYAGGEGNDPISIDLALALKRASGYAYPPHFSPCEMTGQMIDWASVRGIPSVDIELPDHVSTDFATNERVLKAFLLWKLSE